jgi:hypothetical protein
MLESLKIKDFIQSSDIQLSVMAVQYFDDSLNEDEDILNLVLDRCSSASEDEKIQLLAESTHLKLGLEAINTIIENLTAASPQLSYFYNSILLNADISLVKASNLDFQVLLPEVRTIFKQKLQIADSSTEALLEELLEFSLKNDSKYVNEFNYIYGQLISEELSKRKDLDTDKIISTLTATDIDEYSYYECYLLNLAGRRKLNALIPQIINGLGKSDVVSEESMYALIRLGSVDIIDGIVTKYPLGDTDFKIYASGVLENIKLIQSEKAALKLLEKESDITLKTLLAGALCQLYSIEAIPQIKNLIIEGYDTSMLNLEEYAYISCVFNELDIPEMTAWKDAFEEEKNPSGTFSDFIMPEIQKSKAGRNDPCPCGSGKKYKKCCGK